MQIEMLFASRKHDKDTPELVVAWDEYSVDNNPEGWFDAQREGLASWGDDLYRSTVIRVDIPLSAVQYVLNPPEPVLVAEWRNQPQENS